MDAFSAVLNDEVNPASLLFRMSCLRASISYHACGASIFPPWEVRKKEKGMILVTGSTGAIGSALIEDLALLGAPTRALVHTPEKAGTVERRGVEATLGDLGSPETLDAALEDVERAFFLLPPDTC